MLGYILAFLVLAGALFMFKMLYVLATAGALPITQGAVFTPTASVRIEAFLGAVPMRSQEVLIDLGCGDGRVLRAARKRYGVRALGFEVNVLAYCTARILCFAMKGIDIRWGNFWGQNLGRADVVFCYLFPDVMKRLAAKLEEELLPGTHVVSSNFPLPGWDPLKVVCPDSACHGDPMYIYRCPESCPSSKTFGLPSS